MNQASTNMPDDEGYNKERKAKLERKMGSGMNGSLCSNWSVMHRKLLIYLYGIIICYYLKQVKRGGQRIFKKDLTIHNIMSQMPHPHSS